MPALLLAALLSGVSSDFLNEDLPYIEHPTPHISTEMLDPYALTRYHIISRATFADGASAFSDRSAWSWEARANLGIADGLGLSLVLPLTQLRPGASGLTEAYLGNLSVGIGGGGPVGSGLHLAGGFEIAAPTAPAPANRGEAVARALLTAVRGYEAHLYVPRLLSFRSRVQVGFTYESFRADVELALVPAVYTERPADFVMLASGALKASYVAANVVEPYIELGLTRQVAGLGTIDPPFLVSPGVRFHIADLFDPAIFASFNFVESSAVVFGIDLAFAIRPSRRPQEREDDIDLDAIGRFEDGL